MYGLIGSFKAVPGKRAELVGILLAGVGTLPGCKSYVVGEDPGDADLVWITEVWDTQASHQASLQLPAVREAIAKAMPLIAGFGEHKVFNVVGGHGLRD